MRMSDVCHVTVVGCKRVRGCKCKAQSDELARRDKKYSHEYCVGEKVEAFCIFRMLSGARARTLPEQ